MIRMGVDDIAEAVDGTIVTGKEPVDISDLGITTVSSDSRDVVTDGLFVAIRGERADGHDFLSSAASNGFKVALVDHEVADAPLLQIEVDDTLAALGKLARHNIDRRRSLNGDFTLVGITGSVGKTTTKDITKALLSSIAPTVAPIGSFNNNLGLPLTALKVDEKTRYFVAEMGANHLGEIRDLTAIAPPDVSLVLKVGTAHLGEFGSVENIFIAKSEIVEALSENGIAILNSDDANVARMAERTKAQVRWFGLDAGGAHEAGRSLAFSATDISVDDRDRPSFTLLEGGEPAGEIHLSLSGQHNVMNALAAISIATTLGLKLPDVVKVLNEGVSLSPHRMALSTVQVPNGGSFTLVDDSFNANPDSMKAALDGFMHTHPDSYHMAVLGPMLELGSDSVSLHSQVGAYAVAAGVRTIIVVGLEASEGNDSLPVLAQALTDGAREEALRKGATDTVSITTVSDLDTAADAVAAIASSHPDTVVLLKGSHASGLGNLAQQWTQDPPQPSSATAMTATDGE